MTKEKYVVDPVSIATHFKIRSPISAQKQDGKGIAKAGASSSSGMRVFSGGQTQLSGGKQLISANPSLRRAVVLSKSGKKETWVAPDDKCFDDFMKLGARAQAKVPDTGSAGTLRWHAAPKPQVQNGFARRSGPAGRPPVLRGQPVVECFESQQVNRRWQFRPKDQSSGVAALPLSAQVHAAVYDEKDVAARRYDDADDAELLRPDDSAYMPKSDGGGIPGGIISGFKLTAGHFVNGGGVPINARLHAGDCDVRFVGLVKYHDGTSDILVSLTEGSSNKKALDKAMKSGLMQAFDVGDSRLSQLFSAAPRQYVLDPAKGLVTLHIHDESVQDA